MDKKNTDEMEQNLRRINGIYNLNPGRPLSSGAPLKRSYNIADIAHSLLESEISPNETYQVNYDENLNTLPEEEKSKLSEALFGNNEQIEINVAHAEIVPDKKGKNHHNDRDSVDSQGHHKHHHYEHYVHHEHHRNTKPTIEQELDNHNHHHSRHSKDVDQGTHHHRHSHEDSDKRHSHSHRSSKDNKSKHKKAEESEVHHHNGHGHHRRSRDNDADNEPEWKEGHHHKHRSSKEVESKSEHHKRHSHRNSDEHHHHKDTDEKRKSHHHHSKEEAKEEHKSSHRHSKDKEEEHHHHHNNSPKPQEESKHKHKHRNKNDALEGEGNFLIDRYIAESGTSESKARKSRKSKTRHGGKNTVEEFQTIQDIPANIFKEKKKDKPSSKPELDLNSNTLPNETEESDAAVATHAKNRLPSYVFQPPGEETVKKQYQTYQVTEIEPDSAVVQKSVDNGVPPVPNGDTTKISQSSRSGSGSRSGTGSRSSNFSSPVPTIRESQNNSEAVNFEANNGETNNNAEPNNAEQNNAKKSEADAKKSVKEPDIMEIASTTTGNGDVIEIEGMHPVAILDISESTLQQSQTVESVVSKSKLSSYQSPRPSKQNKPEQKKSSTRVVYKSESTRQASSEISYTRSPQLTSSDIIIQSESEPVSGSNNSVVQTPSGSNNDEGSNNDQVDSGGDGSNYEPRSTRSPVEENSQPSMVMTDKGAIRFQLPGRIKHKTTIKVAHYPEANSETVVVNVPTQPETQEICIPAQDPCQQANPCDPYGFYNNQNFSMNQFQQYSQQNQFQQYSQQNQQQQQQQQMSGYGYNNGYNPYGQYNPYASSYPYGYGYPPR